MFSFVVVNWSSNMVRRSSCVSSVHATSICCTAIISKALCNCPIPAFICICCMSSDVSLDKLGDLHSVLLGVHDSTFASNKSKFTLLKGPVLLSNSSIFNFGSFFHMTFLSLLLKDLIPFRVSATCSVSYFVRDMFQSIIRNHLTPTFRLELCFS